MAQPEPSTPSLEIEAARIGVVLLVALYVVLERVKVTSANKQEASLTATFVVVMFVVGLLVVISDALGRTNAIAGRTSWSERLWGPCDVFNDTGGKRSAEPLRKVIVTGLAISIGASVGIWKWTHISLGATVVGLLGGSAGLLLSSRGFSFRSRLSSQTKRHSGYVVAENVLGVAAAVGAMVAPVLEGSSRPVITYSAAPIWIAGSGLAVLLIGVLAVLGSRGVLHRIDKGSSDQGFVEAPSGADAKARRSVSTLSMVLGRRLVTPGLVLRLIAITAVMLVVANAAVLTGAPVFYFVAGALLYLIGDGVSSLLGVVDVLGSVFSALPLSLGRLERRGAFLVATFSALGALVVVVSLGVLLRSHVLVIELGCFFVAPAVFSAVIGGALGVNVRQDRERMTLPFRGVRSFIASFVPLGFALLGLLSLIQLHGAYLHGSDLLSPAISGAFFVLVFPLGSSSWITRRRGDMP